LGKIKKDDLQQQRKEKGGRDRKHVAAKEALGNHLTTKKERREFEIFRGTGF